LKETEVKVELTFGNAGVAFEIKHTNDYSSEQPVRVECKGKKPIYIEAREEQE